MEPGGAEARVTLSKYWQLGQPFAVKLLGRGLTMAFWYKALPNTIFLSKVMRLVTVEREVSEVHTSFAEAEPPEQVQPDSIEQVLLQPSPLATFPSSQGRVNLIPSPQIYLQVDVKTVLTELGIKENPREQVVQMVMVKQLRQ